MEEEAEQLYPLRARVEKSVQQRWQTADSDYWQPFNEMLDKLSALVIEAGNTSIVTDAEHCHCHHLMAQSLIRVLGP